LPTAKGLRFVREIARGGMATVYEVEDGARGVIAAKVLETRNADEVERFRDEQRLVARVGGQAVVPVYEELETDAGFPGFTMELVPGATLEALLERGEVTAARAVAIVASTARALAQVHAARIVHRDVKPANLLVEPTGRIRLLDFGVAEDLEVMDPRREGEISGTPHYFSPEQAQGLPTGPATDTWALGVVLHELLVGSLPFRANDLTELLQDIVTRAPRRPRSLNPALGGALEEIVLRCLEKSPEDRFATADELASALEAQLGEPVAAALAPRPPAPPTSAVPVPVPPKPRREAARLHFRVELCLASSPGRLWPLVSNTETFNKAIGLPAVEFDDTKDPQGGVKRTGRFRRLGMAIEWTEHPFEWVAPERQSVLRVYGKGPIEALWSEVTLTPSPGGGTRLVHQVWMEPRGAIGRVAARLEMARTKGKIRETYRRLDAHARASANAVPDEGRRVESGYARKSALSREGQALLSRGLEALRASSASWAPAVALLEDEIRAAPDFDAARIRPYGLAKRWGIAKPLALRLCLAAAREGLLELAWHLLCPICRVPTRTLTSLSELTSRSHCKACDVSYENDLASSVELAFRPSPAVRAIPDVTYCLGGPGHFTHVVAQQELDPGEERALEVVLEPGAWRLASRGARHGWDFRVSAGETESVGRDDRTRVVAPGLDLVAAGPPPFEGPIEVAIEGTTLEPGPPCVRGGLVRLRIRNATPRRELLRLENVAWREDALTAFEACGDPEVLALSGPIAGGEPIRIGRGAYLAAASASEDGAALDRVFEGAVRKHGGVLATAERVAAFPAPAAAIEAALAVHELARASAELANRPPKLAVQAGPSVIAVLGGELGFQGAAPAMARRLLEECLPGEVATTHHVLGTPAVGSLVLGRATRAQRRRSRRESLGVIYVKG
jgi:serine/threonine protein kinase